MGMLFSLAIFLYRVLCLLVCLFLTVLINCYFLPLVSTFQTGLAA